MPDPDPRAKTKKYFFDQNDFAEHQAEPEPTFTLPQLEAARRESFEQGRRAGLAEAKAQREKMVADLLAAIKLNFAALFDAENQRAAQYEAETLFLCQAVFRRVFPGLNERQGLEEIKRAVMLVMQGQRTQPEIVIEVAPEFTDEIRDHIGQLPDTICTVQGNASLGPGDCRLRWEDGGAQRSATQLAAEISHLFAQTLADRPTLRDNREEPALIAAPEIPHG